MRERWNTCLLNTVGGTEHVVSQLPWCPAEGTLQNVSEDSSSFSKPGVAAFAISQQAQKCVTLCLPYLVAIVQHIQNAPLSLHVKPHVLSFLLPSLRSSRLRCFLPITPYHNKTQKAPYHGRSEKDKNNWYADSPDAGRKEVVERVTLIDERLAGRKLAYAREQKGGRCKAIRNSNEPYHEKGPRGIV